MFCRKSIVCLLMSLGAACGNPAEPEPEPTDSSTAGMDSAGAHARSPAVGSTTAASGDGSQPDAVGSTTPAAETSAEETQSLDTQHGADDGGEAGGHAIAEVADGACTNDDDTQTLLAREQTLDDVISSCVFECFGAGSACSSQCLQRDIGLSEACADCFGDMMNCTVNNCALQCLDAASPDCADCQAQHCNAEFEACAGIVPQR